MHRYFLLKGRLGGSQGLMLRRLLTEEAGASQKASEAAKKPSWMTSTSHGHHVLQGQTFRIDQSNRLEADNVVIHREQIGHLELWFYGVSDVEIGNWVHVVTFV
ncbi:hypothetical protein Ancab_013083 [Ancistrocladus abbreviatus]